MKLYLSVLLVFVGLAAAGPAAVQEAFDRFLGEEVCISLLCM